MPEKALVLVVDDNAVNRQILQKILETEYRVLQAENGKAALELLERQRKPVAAVILDLRMPVMDGYTFLERVREEPIYAEIPVIVATGLGNIEEEKRSLELGAKDFVTKPYDADILRFRLKNAIIRNQLNAFAELKYMAERDILTGIYNKNKFQDSTHQMLLENSEKTYVLVRLDIDRFQLINSFFGTKVGDELLKYMASLLEEEIQSQEEGVYGRIEADVFAFCIPDRGPEALIEMVSKCRSRLREFPIKYDIVPSIGIYLIEDHNEDVTVMLDKAGLAAKQIKGKYLSDYAFYDKKLSVALEQEQWVINEMARALKQEQFQVYLQPKYSLQTNRPVGAEALVRWIHPERGMISPGSFIPIFERNGFIIKLDYYMWEAVCKLLRRWIDEGRNPDPISVNVSRVNIYNPGFIETVCGLTEKYGIPNHLLELEITESAYTDNPEVMRETIRQLQARDFVILMDDFGSAYSSLNILKDIEMDILKIDMKFMQDAEKPGRGQSILAAIVEMAKWLHLPVIAEGVEKREQVEFLQGIGCECVQGYYFATPMPVPEYERLRQSQMASPTEG